jgi:3-oxoacyl-[acyl-carrier protein] reductase
MQLKEVRAIVTGAGRGMGAHFARRLAEAGAQVAAGDIDEAALAELPAGIHKRKLDVRRESDCVEFTAWAREAMGGLNSLVNNAGIIRDGLLVRRDKTTGEIKKMTAEDWRAVLDVNLSGATFMVRETVALMLQTETRPGIVVNMSSISRLGNKGQSNYVATKAALAANTVTWSREWASYGIRCVAVAPGMVETPMTQGMHQKARDALVAAIPVGRIGLPEDIWLAVKFAIECEYMNGRTLEVDGGLTMA